MKTATTPARHRRARRRRRRQLLARSAQRTVACARWPSATASARRGGAKQRKLLYYRNPMGLADTSPTPKKDPMGMDYIAVYEGEDEDASAAPAAPTRSASAPRRSRSWACAPRPPACACSARRCAPRAAIEPDERRVFAIAPKFEGYVERLHVNVTGQPVAKGQPLFEVYSPELVSAQREYAHRDAGPAGDEGRRRRGAGRHEAAGRVEPGAPAQLGPLRRRRSTALMKSGDSPAHDHLPLAGVRRRHREEGAAGHALHAGRDALPGDRPVVGLGHRRRVRAGHRPGQDRRQGARHDQRLPERGVRRPHHLRLPDA